MCLTKRNLERYGCDCCKCGGSRGFCHSCFDAGFNEDSWEKEQQQQAQQRESKKSVDGNAGDSSGADADGEATKTTHGAENAVVGEGSPVQSQPEKVAEMSVEKPSSGVEGS